VPAPTSTGLADVLRPLTSEPEDAAVLCDVDGTLAPIVERAEDAAVAPATADLLTRLSERYRLVACVSGRSALEARRLVGVDGLTYAGAHGAELLEPGSERARSAPGVEEWRDAVQRFAREGVRGQEHELGLRLEDKGAIAALHWRGASNEAAAEAAAVRLGSRAEDAGLRLHRGRKVLEIRPPVPFDKGRAVRELIDMSGARAALFGGDDVTDLDAFAALAALRHEGALAAAVAVGVASDEGPGEIIERADLVVEGIEGYAAVLSALARG
jgi:trehalose 6-phosphate phosphatase